MVGLGCLGGGLWTSAMNFVFSWDLFTEFAMLSTKALI